MLNPRPPIAWFNRMKRSLKKTYPKKHSETKQHYDVALARIVGGIWWNYEPSVREKLISRYDNPFFSKTDSQRRAMYNFARSKGLTASHAQRVRDWRSPKLFRMMGEPVPSLSERRSMGLVNPLPCPSCHALNPVTGAGQSLQCKRCGKHLICVRITKQ